MKSLTALVKKAKCKLTVCPLEESREDQWMQVRGPLGGRAGACKVHVPGVKSNWGVWAPGGLA